MTDQPAVLAAAQEARWAGESLDSPARDLRYAILKHPHPVPGMTAEVGSAWQEHQQARAAAQAAEARLRNLLGSASVALAGGVPVAERVVASAPAERVTEDFFSAILPREPGEEE